MLCSPHPIHALSAILPSQPVEANVTCAVCFQPCEILTNTVGCYPAVILSPFPLVCPLSVQACAPGCWTLFWGLDCSKPIVHGLIPFISNRWGMNMWICPGQWQLRTDLQGDVWESFYSLIERGSLSSSLGHCFVWIWHLGVPQLSQDHKAGSVSRWTLPESFKMLVSCWIIQLCNCLAHGLWLNKPFIVLASFSRVFWINRQKA